MRYRDGKGRLQTLTWVQALYLDTAHRQFSYGWGGLRSTLTVRLLEERGLLTLRRGYPDVADWTVTGLTQLGATVLAAWGNRVQR